MRTRDLDQQQFLDVIDRDEAERRFWSAVQPRPLEAESVALDDALGCILAHDVAAPVDVPSFDRSDYDGFAVQAMDTFGADEHSPKRLRLAAATIAPGHIPRGELARGEAIAIATGGMVPRGADAILMVEHSEVEQQTLLARKSVTPGFGITFAGSDIARGEIVLREGDVLTSRETGVLAAIGVPAVMVRRRPIVAIVSTGDELAEPGQPLEPGRIYDSNAQILSDAVRELGAIPRRFGIVPDDEAQLARTLNKALESCDVVLLSGGTSKGAGDLSYRVVGQLDDPGMIVHGVALKPGKPICLAASRGKAVAVLPGFPTSAIFTFHEFVAPLIRHLAGRTQDPRTRVTARLAVRLRSEVGRTEYVLVGLVPRGTAAGQLAELVAYPMGKGSGSVTTFSRADGFIRVDRHEEIVERDSRVEVQLLGRDLRPADLIVIGSHCLGLDLLLSRLQRAGFHAKFLAVGSTAGLAAVERGECDLAGIHLLDPDTGLYNTPFITQDLQWVPGYVRTQGVVFRCDDARFAGPDARSVLARVVQDPSCVMVNRNQGSGTRILIDQLLGDARPQGYSVATRNHHAVAAAVEQGRADWGIAIETVARPLGLGFLPLVDEHYDFVVAKGAVTKPAVATLVQLLEDPGVRAELDRSGLRRYQRAQSPNTAGTR